MLGVGQDAMNCKDLWAVGLEFEVMLNERRENDRNEIKTRSLKNSSRR